MQAVGGREQSRRRASGAPGGGGSGAEEESTGCSMYAEAPTADVALEEFEQLALQRLAGAPAPLRPAPSATSPPSEAPGPGLGV